MNKEEQSETELAEMRLDEETPEYNEQRADIICKILQREKLYRVLDVGCGLGKVTVYLAQNGLNVMGIDISPRLIDLARKKAAEKNIPLHFEVIELSKLMVDEKFDAVLFAGVLEHIDDEEQLMRDAQRVLKEGGKIIITDMPTFQWLYHPRDRKIGHVRRYTKELIRKKLIAQGYTNIKLRYYNFLMLFGSIYLLLFKKDEYPYGTINKFTKKFLHIWYKYLENRFIFPVGDRLIAVAEYWSARDRGY